MAILTELVFIEHYTQQRNILIFQVHMECLPRKTIMYHNVRVKFQRTEVFDHTGN